MGTMMTFPETPGAAVAFFAIYAFFGWLVEVAYRSATQRRFVNAGFLFGPFVPLYGMGALLVLALGSLMAGWHPALVFLAIGVVLTALEYLFGFLSERLFDLTLWDYSANRFNLHGRVCLLYSVAWTALAFGVSAFVHPFVTRFVGWFDEQALRWFAAAFAVYYAIDIAFSVAAVLDFRRRLTFLLANFVTLANPDVERFFDTFRRLLRAFPNLNRQLTANLSENLKRRIDDLLASVGARIQDELKGRTPAYREYKGIVRDILEHPEFKRLKEFYHHNSSIYEHAVRVSFLSYRICRYLNLDYHSAARGGLLHDFFLYDWRNHDEPDLARDKFHGIHHPRIALENATAHFAINDVERDIIVKHMWPLTLAPPRYRESFVVGCVDKYLASKELLGELPLPGGRRKRPGRARRVRTGPA